MFYLPSPYKSCESGEVPVIPPHFTATGPTQPKGRPIALAMISPGVGQSGYSWGFFFHLKVEEKASGLPDRVLRMCMGALFSATSRKVSLVEENGSM